MNRFMSLLQFLPFTSLLFPVVARCHDGWIQVNSIVEKGQPITIALMLGNHSNEHGSFRIAGKWDAKYTKLLVIDPKGEATDITSAIIDMGEDPEKTGPKGPKGFHLARFIPKVEGVHIVLARQERMIQQDNGSKLFTFRNARSNFVSLANPRVAEAQMVNGFDRKYALDHLLEIVPVTQPLGIGQKASITLEVLHKGKPAANKTVTVIGRFASKASAQDLTTDAKGRIRVSVDAADTYLARLKFDEENRVSSAQLEKRSYEATYVFQVFNHH